MDNLSIDELKQLLAYYKQRSADLEFALLQLQLKTNAITAEKSVVSDQKKQK